jgi:hypothetical protein
MATGKSNQTYKQETAMDIYNNTPNEAFYGISYAGAGDCGTIEAGATVSLPGYDNQTNVSVDLSCTSPQVPSPFNITINDTGTGKVVTVGLYFE